MILPVERPIVGPLDIPRRDKARRVAGMLISMDLDDM